MKKIIAMCLSVVLLTGCSVKDEPPIGPGASSDAIPVTTDQTPAPTEPVIEDVAVEEQGVDSIANEDQQSVEAGVAPTPEAVSEIPGWDSTVCDPTLYEFSQKLRDTGIFEYMTAHANESIWVTSHKDMYTTDALGVLYAAGIASSGTGTGKLQLPSNEDAMLSFLGFEDEEALIGGTFSLLANSLSDAEGKTTFVGMTDMSNGVIEGLPDTSTGAWQELTCDSGRFEFNEEFQSVLQIADTLCLLKSYNDVNYWIIFPKSSVPTVFLGLSEDVLKYDQCSFATADDYLGTIYADTFELLSEFENLGVDECDFHTLSCVGINCPGMIIKEDALCTYAQMDFEKLVDFVTMDFSWKDLANVEQVDVDWDTFDSLCIEYIGTTVDIDAVIGVSSVEPVESLPEEVITEDESVDNSTAAFSDEQEN